MCMLHWDFSMFPKNMLRTCFNANASHHTSMIIPWPAINVGKLISWISLLCVQALPGRYGFIAQLNEGRATKKRPTEFSADLVMQAFDDNKFNFTKISQKEVLFQFEPSTRPRTQYQEDAKVSGNPHLVLINVSPIEYGHVLLVPRILDKLPQQVCCFAWTENAFDSRYCW